MRKLISVLLTALCLSVGVLAQRLSNSTAQINDGSGAAATRYHYLFENERFTTPRLEIEFDGEGRGKFIFINKDKGEIANPLNVSAGLLAQIQMLFDELRFLESGEDYQHKKDFSHLGTMTITLNRNGRERTAKFNYTLNAQMNRLADIFRNLATQETRAFELETVLNTDPISMPAQMRMLDSELRGNHIADPQRFVPILQNLKTDEGVPLIARNDAERLLKRIQKGKKD